jgi:ribokinase
VILVFGSINLDLVLPVPALPAPGETVLGPGFTMQPGGKGANQALAAARDGAMVILAGSVGRDAFAAPALALLREAGVDLSRVATTDAPTGIATIAVDPTGKNLIVVASGANAQTTAAQVEDTLLTPGTTLLLQREVAPVESALLAIRAKQRGCRVVLNTAPAGPFPEEALAAIDVLVANEVEATALGARSAAGLAQLHGIPAVVITRGEAGVEVATPSETFALPAHIVAVRDTTAAGDTFTGVLAAALDRGLALRDAVARANAAAALCCTREGTQPSIPLAVATDALLATAA